ncbi:hypothetical protein ACMFMG_012132 [Clarireedia jacksonii]
MRCSSRSSACPPAPPSSSHSDQLCPTIVASQIDRLIGSPAKLSSYLSEVYAALETRQEEEEKEEETRQLQRTPAKSFCHLSEDYAELATRQKEEQQKEKEKQEEEIRQLRWTSAKYFRRLSEAYAKLVARREEEEEKEKEKEKEEEEEEEEEEKEEEEEEEEAYGTNTVTVSTSSDFVHPSSREPTRPRTYSQEEKDFIRYYYVDRKYIALRHGWKGIAVAFDKQFKNCPENRKLRNLYFRSQVPKYEKNGKLRLRHDNICLRKSSNAAASKEYSLLKISPGRALKYEWVTEPDKRTAKAYMKTKSERQREFEFSMRLQNIPPEEYKQGLIWLQTSKKG